MVVHPVSTGQQFDEVVIPNVQGNSHTDGGPQAVPERQPRIVWKEIEETHLPPTQSQNSNMLASSMPNLVTKGLLVLHIEDYISSGSLA